jgi:hypothetical protein
MIFDGKPTREITADEVRQLVTDHIAEDVNLDYKEKAYDPRDPNSGAELLKDVSAFANADGGYLVIGVRDDGAGCAAEFVNVPNAESARQSMISRCLEKIEPRLNGLDVRCFDVDGNFVLIVHVPESDRKPHCAKPDAEHQYFWRRYVDGNKLMSTAEIRECFEADRVHRELVTLRREFAEHSRQHIVSREAEMEVDDTTLFRLKGEDRFLDYVKKQFLAAVGDKPYYRLLATPLPINGFALRNRQADLAKLFRNPPRFRSSGWDVTPVSEFRTTSIGMVCERTDFHHLRLLWNGHIEFWTPADDDSFHWLESFGNQRPYRFLLPLAIIEPAGCFVELAREVCRIADHHGDVRFGLGLYHISGQKLLPYAPEAMGYRLALSGVGPHVVQPFDDENLIVGSVTSPADDLPGTVAWKLVSQVYYRFGYSDAEIPFFDGQHRWTLDERPQVGTGGL